MHSNTDRRTDGRTDIHQRDVTTAHVSHHVRSVPLLQPLFTPRSQSHTQPRPPACTSRSYSWGSCLLCFVQREAKNLCCKLANSLYNRNRFDILSLLSKTLLRRIKNVHISYTKWRNGRPMDNLLETAKMCQLLGTSSPRSRIPGTGGLRPWTPLGDFLTRNSQSASASGGVVPIPPTRASPLLHWGTWTSVPQTPFASYVFPLCLRPWCMLLRCFLIPPHVTLHYIRVI